MTDVRHKILSLPNLQLTDEEWAELTTIIASLKDKTIEAFKVYYNEIASSERIINPKKTSQVLLFVAAWFDMTQSIILWIQHLNKVWSQILKKNMSADYLIPLIVELLPDDADQLKLLQQHLDIALRITDTSERGCYLSNVCIATYAKLSEFIENNYTTENNILIIAKEVNAIEQIASLIPVCINYKDYLRDTFILLFQAEDKDTYQQYVELSKENIAVSDKNNLIEMVIKNLSMDKLNLKNPCLLSWLEKYFVLYEMHVTLLRENISATNCLIEFAAKFFQHYEILTKDLDSTARTFLKKTNANLGIDRVFGWEDTETKFMKLAGFFSKKVQFEGEKRGNISKLNINRIC